MKIYKHIKLLYIYFKILNIKIERFTIEGQKSNKPYIQRTKNHKLPFIYIKKKNSTHPLKEKPFFWIINIEKNLMN